MDVTFPDKLLVRWVNFLSQYWGVPFQFSPLTGKLIFAYSSVPKVVCINLAMFACIIMFIALIFGESGPNDVQLVATELNYSVLDMVVNQMVFVIAFTGSILIFVSFWKRAEAVSEVLDSLGSLKLSPSFGESARNNVMKTAKRLIPVMMVILVIAPIYGYLMVEEAFGPIFPLSDTSGMKLGTIAAFPISILATYFNPNITGLSFLTHYMLGLVVEAFENLEERLGVPRNQGQRKDLKSAVDLGFDISNILDLANSVLEPFMLIFSGLYLGILTSTLYCASSGMFRTLSIFKRLEVAAYWCVSLMSFIALASFCSTGQELENKRAKARKTLETRLRHADDLGDDLATEMRLLADTLGQPHPVCPYSMFGVNNSSFLCTIATIVTYLIVLVQFRLS